jgi:hypothetical protein
MTTPTIRALLALGLISLTTANASAATITFGTGDFFNLDTSPYSESGFLFSQVAGSGSHVGPVLSPSDGALTVEGTVQITRIGGGLFDLLSLDVVFRSSLDALGTFDLVTSKGGTRNLAGVTSYTFSGTDFQGLSWVNLVDVRGGFFSDNNAVDNIRLNATVPEPSAVALLAVGGGMVGWLFRWRRRASTGA